MRILELALSFSPGGRREAVISLARGLTSAGVQPDLVCVDALGCDRGELEGLFGRIDSLDRKRHGNRAALAQLVQFCDSRQIQLIHAHGAASQFLAAKLRLRRPKIKLAMTFHRSLGHDSATWKDKLRNGLAGLACSAIVVGSRERRRHYLSENFVAARKVIRIPFGVDLHRYRPDATVRKEMRRQLGVASDSVLIGAAGHFGREKGIDIAIRSFLELRLLQPQAKAKLIVLGRGTGEQEAALRDLATAAGDAIQFAGFRADAERYFGAMDVFLHTPRLEAFGLVVAEAMACGLAIVATDVGGVPDMVRRERTGMLVPVEQPKIAAAMLSRLFENEELRRALSAEALRVARAEYSVELYAQRHLEMYEAAIAGRRPHGVDDMSPEDHSAVQQMVMRCEPLRKGAIPCPSK